MRVGLICPYSLTVPGGVQGQVLGLARSLRSAGVEARVLGPCDGPPPEAWVTPLGNSLPTGDNGSMAAIAPDPSASLRVLRALRDEAFDVVHVHEPLAPGPSITATLVSQAPVVVTFHRSGDSNWVKATRRLCAWGLRNAAARVAVSREAELTVTSLFPGDYEVLWNGIETSRYDNAPPWPTTRPTVLFVGRHEPRKGLAVLLEAFELLAPEAGLWVAGHGPETDRLRRIHEDRRIEWLGLIGEDEKIRRIRGAAVLCAPSLYGESFGVVLLEAMAAGTPLVASDISGYREVARAEVDARLVPPGDPAALAKALSSALQDAGRSAEMVAAGRRRAEELSMDSLAAAYLELYERVIRERRRPGPNGRTASPSIYRMGRRSKR